MPRLWAGLTLLSERVARGHALCVGDHAGEDAQILQGGAVEDGSGPERGDSANQANGDDLTLSLTRGSWKSTGMRTLTCSLR